MKINRAKCSLLHTLGKLRKEKNAFNVLNGHVIASEALSLGIVYRNEGVRSYRNKHVYTYTHIQAETISGNKSP